MNFEDFTDLPPHLKERARIDPGTSRSAEMQGDYVLYWLRTAVRSEENPALDLAKILADELGVPLLVYHSISQNYRFASDRHHTFMLQGARDLHAQMNEAGISYAFHLATRTDSKSHLVTLAKQAAVVVTEEMPVDPALLFQRALRRQITTPLVCVDTSCVVPMQLVKKDYTRAFEFRSATKQLYEERVSRAWPKLDLVPSRFDLNKLPFANWDLERGSFQDWLAQCEIDHAVGPVVDTVGGTAAGYARWDRFAAQGLTSYAKRRNNALIDGVSRMSAYLHYGMVSPMRLAREAAGIRNGGGEKYLDELLIWRELAYAFCFHRGRFDPWKALPHWAQQTLEQHAHDPREYVYSWEELARAQTHDPLWNAAQTSLLRQGELHNNVRMTWGKAILNWTQSPQKALTIMIDLNHRYALDGRDPASYGGLLWCLGQFDRPFEPEQKVFGTVRLRSSTDHAKRLNPGEYYRKVATPRFDINQNVAVIGAGISGLMAARTLADHGLQVKVFDKGRGVGGRMSTRRVDGVSCFDHGAQYFTARDHRFRRYVNSWLEQGIVARWPDANGESPENLVVLDNGKKTIKENRSVRNLDERFVGVPAMSSVCNHLAEDLQVQTSTRVESIESNSGSASTWKLYDNQRNELGSFQHLVVSAPAEQSAELLKAFPSIALPISKIKMQPCWATMVSLAKPVGDDWVGAFIHNSILSWAARNNTKPGRPCEQEHLLLHAGHEWTSQNWDREPEEVAKELLQAFWQAAGIEAQEPVQLQAHRWRYAIPVDVPESRCYDDEEASVVACGDWAGGPRVEGAFLSGMAAAGTILRRLQLASADSSTQLQLGF